MADLASYIEKKAPGYRVAVYGACTPAELYSPDGKRLHQWSARAAGAPQELREGVADGGCIPLSAYLPWAGEFP